VTSNQRSEYLITVTATISKLFVCCNETLAVHFHGLIANYAINERAASIVPGAIKSACDSGCFVSGAVRTDVGDLTAVAESYATHEIRVETIVCTSCETDSRRFKICATEFIFTDANITVCPDRKRFMRLE